MLRKQSPVKIYKVKAESISNYIRATGSVTGDEDVILYSKVAESVQEYLCKTGSAGKERSGSCRTEK